MNTMTEKECRIYFNENLKAWVTQRGDGFYVKDVDYNNTALAAVSGAEDLGLAIKNKAEMEYHVSKGS